MKYFPHALSLIGGFMVGWAIPADMLRIVIGLTGMALAMVGNGMAAGWRK